jgi:hypothetical protein
MQARAASTIEPFAARTLEAMGLITASRQQKATRNQRSAGILIAHVLESLSVVPSQQVGLASGQKTGKRGSIKHRRMADKDPLA